MEAGAGSQRQLEDIRAQLAANHADIEVLRERADAADLRAHESEGHADEDRRRIDELEARTDIDRAMILELQAEGILSREHTANLEVALHSARLIGAAIGIVMASWRVDEVMAFEILKKASQDGNRKVRTLAEEIVHTGDVSRLRAG